MILAVETLTNTPPILPNWVQWLILVGAGGVGVNRVWKLIIRPIARIINLVDHVQPVLDELANEFRPDHGESLYDIIHAIHGKIDLMNKRIDNVEEFVGQLDEKVNPPEEVPEIMEVFMKVVAEAIENERSQDES